MILCGKGDAAPRGQSGLLLCTCDDKHYTDGGRENNEYQDELNSYAAVLSLSIHRPGAGK